MTAPLDRIDRLFAHNARTLPDAIHLYLPDGGTQTWRQTYTRAGRLAAALVQAGVAKGDRVLVLTGNSRELQELYVGCGIAAAICVPVNILTTARELAATAADCTPAALFIDHTLLDRASPELLACVPRLKVVLRAPAAGWSEYETLLAAHAPLAEPVPSSGDDPGIMIYSSGTTGKPKGILLRQRGVVENAVMTQAVARYQQADRNLAMLGATSCSELGPQHLLK